MTFNRAKKHVTTGGAALCRTDRNRAIQTRFAERRPIPGRLPLTPFLVLPTMIWFLTSVTPFTPLAIDTALSTSAWLLAFPDRVTTPLSSVSTLMCIALTCLSLTKSALILVVITESLIASFTVSFFGDSDFIESDFE